MNMLELRFLCRFTVKEEDGVARVPLTRLGGSYGDVSVRYDIQSVSAIEGQDFVGTGGVVQFNNGVDAATINVTLNDDTEMEFEETFTLQLTITSGEVSVQSLMYYNNIWLMSLDP